MKRIATFGLMAAVLGIGLAALAQSPLKNPRMAQKLNLTAQQKSQLKDVRFQHQAKMIDIRHDMQIKMLDLRRELSKDNPNEAALDRLADQMASIRARMMKERFAHMLAVKKVLTPEQWNMVKEHFMQRRGMKRGRFQRGPRDGKCPMGEGPGCGAGPMRGCGMGPGMGPGPGPGAVPPPDAPDAPQP